MQPLYIATEGSKICFEVITSTMFEMVQMTPPAHCQELYNPDNYALMGPEFVPKIGFCDKQLTNYLHYKNKNSHTANSLKIRTK